MENEEIIFSGKETKYYREKLRCNIVLPARGVLSNDFLSRKALAEFEGLIFKHKQGEFYVSLPRPSFLDWLLRRRKRVRVDVNRVVKSPPTEDDNTIVYYEITRPLNEGEK
jgi:hypothetical protein